ncbi:MAG: hypothetical protein MZU95_05780 [Desulfomicrobium escambiense]|nr:hypothetical protein [Desulfomicrobium escambiense]
MAGLSLPSTPSWEGAHPAGVQAVPAVRNGREHLQGPQRFKGHHGFLHGALMLTLCILLLRDALRDGQGRFLQRMVLRPGHRKGRFPSCPLAREPGLHQYWRGSAWMYCCADSTRADSFSPCGYGASR